MRIHCLWVWEIEFIFLLSLIFLLFSFFKGWKSPSQFSIFHFLFPHESVNTDKPTLASCLFYFLFNTCLVIQKIFRSNLKEKLFLFTLNPSHINEIPKQKYEKPRTNFWFLSHRNNTQSLFKSSINVESILFIINPQNIFIIEWPKPNKPRIHVFSNFSFYL